ncbi:MAG: hypothetical protein AAF797_03835 [Planctomycetota bacterium]
MTRKSSKTPVSRNIEKNPPTPPTSIRHSAASMIAMLSITMLWRKSVAMTAQIPPVLSTAGPPGRP